MKLVYYTTAYNSAHGGSNHSRYFFKNAGVSPLVTAIEVIPAMEDSPEKDLKGDSFIRSILRKFSLAQILFFYRRNRFYLKLIKRELTLRKPDAVLIRLDSNFLQILFIRTHFPKIIVATEVNASPFDESFKNIAFRSWFKQKERKYLSLSHCNFFVSDHLRKKIMANDLLEGRDFVVPNGVDCEVFAPMENKMELKLKFNLPTDKAIVGYVGTVDVHKRIDLLIVAFAEVVARIPKSVLIIVGDGPDVGNCKNVAKRLKITDSVYFVGWVSHSLIPEYLNCFSVAVHHHASDYMSPLKIFEYLAVGLPVIGPNVTSVREIFEDQIHLMLCACEASDIAEKIIKLLLSPTLSEGISVRGRELVVKYYPWKENVNRILTSINDKRNHTTETRHP